MTRAEWAHELRLLGKRRTFSAWKLAWLLADGQREGWDSDFAEAATLTGYSRSHLWNLYRVGVAFPEGTECPRLSFAVHRELLREPDEDARRAVLDRAIDAGWGQEDVVAWFEAHPPTPRAVSEHPKSAANRRYYVGTQVECPHCHERFQVKGNKTRRSWIDKQGVTND